MQTNDETAVQTTQPIWDLLYPVSLFVSKI